MIKRILKNNFWSICCRFYEENNAVVDVNSIYNKSDDNNDQNDEDNDDDYFQSNK